MAKGVYKITNDQTGEVYIGQTNNLYLRKKQHMEDLSSGSHHNRRMQQDYNRGNTFSFEVLEYVNGSRNELYQREKAQIRNHNSFYAGYNQTPGGEYDKYKGRYQYGGGRKQVRKVSSNYNSRPSSNKSDSSDLGCVFAAIFLFFFVGIAGTVGNSIIDGLGMLFAVFAFIVGAVLLSVIFDSSDENKSGRNKSSVNNKYFVDNYTHVDPKYKSTLQWNICPKCGRKYDKKIKKCSYCGYRFK